MMGLAMLTATKAVTLFTSGALLGIKVVLAMRSVKASRNGRNKRR